MIALNSQQWKTKQKDPILDGKMNGSVVVFPSVIEPSNRLVQRWKETVEIEVGKKNFFFDFFRLLYQPE